MNDIFAIADSAYVLLSTRRANNDWVGTPVWVVRDGERLLVTTGATSGKVKRITRNERVMLQVCDARGTVKPGAQAVEAVAVVDGTAETRARLDAALLAKYKLQFRFLRWMRRNKPDDSTALVITAA